MLTSTKKHAPKQLGTVSVGFSGYYPGGQSVADVALFLEYGTADMPPRYFLTRAIENSRSALSEYFIKLQKLVDEDKISPNDAEKKYGEKLVEAVKLEIAKQGLVSSGRLINGIKVLED